MIRFFLMLVLIWAQAGWAWAELQWRSTGPGGGGAFESIAKGRQGSLLIGSDLSGAYRSINGGARWQVIGRDHGLDNTHVDAVAFDADHDDIAFIGAGDGLYRSTDCFARGEAPCQFEKRFSGQVQAIQSAGNVAYAAGLAGWCQQGPKIWASPDRGATWAAKPARGLPLAANIMALRVQPGKPDVLVAISNHGRFGNPDTCGQDRWPAAAPARAYISRDGGDSFAPLVVLPKQKYQLQTFDGATSAYVEDVKFDFSRPDRIWLTVMPDQLIGTDMAWRGDGETWLSDDVGRSFRRVNEKHSGQIWPLSKGGIRLLDLRNQRPWNATEEIGFWELDGATTAMRHITTAADYAAWDLGWSGAVAAPQASFNGSLQTFLPVDDAEAWWVDIQFAYSTTDGGHVVQQRFTTPKGEGFVSRGLDNAVPVALAASAADPSQLWAGYFDMGCWGSGNAQAAEPAWQACNGVKADVRQPKSLADSELTGRWRGYGGYVFALAADPEDAKTVWAVHKAETTHVIGRSSDGFRTYEALPPITAGAAAAVTALIVEAPEKGKRRLWALALGRLWRLDWGEKEWTQVPAKDCGSHSWMHLARRSGTMIMGGDNGTCVSHDEGAHWTSWRGWPEQAHTDQVWWLPFEQSPKGVSDFAFDPSNPKVIWMTAMFPSEQVDSPDAGLYKSVDGGATFARMKTFGTGSFERNFLRTVVVDPRNPKTVIVGSSSAMGSGGLFHGVQRMGAFVSRDGGASWRVENKGLAWPFITRLRFVGQRLYGISPGQGIVFSDMP